MNSKKFKISSVFVVAYAYALGINAKVIPIEDRNQNFPLNICFTNHIF